MSILFSFFLIPSYQLGFAFLIYIISFLSLLRTLIFRSSFIIPILLYFQLLCIALSVYIYCLYDNLYIAFQVSRFYFGISFFIFAFSFIRISSLYFVRSFYIFSFIEFFYFKLIGSYPYYITNHFNSLNINAFARAEVIDNTVRLFGPALNSSVTSSLIAVLLLLYIRKLFFSISHPILSNLKRYDIVFLIATFLLCGSGVGFFVLGLGILLYFLKLFVLLIRSFSIKSSLIHFLLFIFLISISFYYSEFGENIISTKISLDYLVYVLTDKLNSIGFDHLSAFLFGGSATLIDSNIVLGGDFVLLNMLSICGLLPSLTFFGFFYYLFSTLNLQLIFLILFISSFHYGSIFNFVSQVFIATLLSLSFRRESLL